MLTTLSSFFSHHLQAANSSLNVICRKPLASAITVSVIAITLSLPTLFWIFSKNLHQVTTQWQQNGRISLYLKTDLPRNEQNRISERVKTIAGVQKIQLKSPEEGLEELQQQEGMQDIIRYLPQNPLPAVIEVYPALTYTQPLQMQQLLTSLRLVAGVDDVKWDIEWIRRLHAILDFARKLARTVFFLLGLAVSLIIWNTLRLAIHNHREEIRILKLVGATDPFIARPFLYCGMWYSMGGAILTVFFVNLFLLRFSSALNELSAVYQMSFPFLRLNLKQAYSLVFFSVFLGWIGAKLALMRQLASIEP